MSEDGIKQITKEVNQLLSDLEVKAEVQVVADQDPETLMIQIDSEEAASLIGFHGENLQAVQTILSFLVHKKTDKWPKLLVNVGDYRQKREEQLQKLALNLAMKVKFSKEAQMIPNLSAFERRIVHLALSDHPDVYTESEGEGKFRQLTIKSKTA